MLFVLIESNSVISKHQKINLNVTYIIIFVICIMEVLTIIFDGSVCVLWFLISMITKNGNSVFFVDEQNNYSQAKGFLVYMIFYGLGLVYFLIQNINLSIHSIFFWISFLFLQEQLFRFFAQTFKSLGQQLWFWCLCISFIWTRFISNSTAKLILKIVTVFINHSKN